MEFWQGSDRTAVTLEYCKMGEGFIVRIYNENPHIGAVAVGDYDAMEKRSSCSLITRLGHKDDIIAMNTAHKISKLTKKPVCVIVGIHIDNITQEEIKEVTENCNHLVDVLLQYENYS